MKTRTLFLILIFGLTSTVFSQSFYDINTINTIEVTFEESNWDYLLDQLVSNGEEERLMGSVTINGQVFDSVGVRYKGNSSYNANQVKNPLNIKLDYTIDDQKIEGYGTLKLANVFKDPSFVREALSYEIARNYFPASEANYANVYINGTHLGLYTSVQSVDKFFMRTHLGSDEGARLKGEITGGGGQPSGSVWEYFGTDSTDYFNYYELKSDYGWMELIEFLDTLSNHSEYVDQVLNIDRHLWFLAFQNLLVNLDGPINNPQNYYVFQDGTGRFNPIPWDLNESFGVFRSLQGGGNLNTYQLQTFSPFNNLTSSNHPIISKILSNDTYSKMYIAHMKTMLEEIFANGWYEDRALEIQAIIDADVQADNNKFYSYSNFLSNIHSSVGGGPNAVIGITQLMDARVNYLLGLNEFEAQQPEFSNISFSPEQPAPNTEIWFSAEVDYGTLVYLSYRQSSTAVFQKTEMYDDGNHNDGAAGDGVYGASLVAGNTGIQYYFYAENNDAAAFMPAHAEMEYYSISITSDLVINEFMADNETTVMDQDGEYDDWIELYNNGTEDIALGGYYLSDDPGDPGQWTFPDTTIAAGGYLVVWADNDEEQEGLHANFKISKSGESLILSNPTMELIDEVSFGAQLTDTTFGRFPNGTGEFMFMPPTFGTENSLSSGVNYDDLVINEFLADNESIVMDQNGEYDAWIEIYNNGAEGFEMSGMYLSNDAALPGMWVFPDTTIGSGEYLIVWADNDLEQEGLHAGFILAQAGGTLLFSDPDTNIVDEHTYGDQLSDISTGRYPNGTGGFILMPPSFGAENTTSSSGQYDDLVINEFMADNETTVMDQDGEYDDWIELFNNGDVELALSGLYLSDDATEPNMWPFPDTTIAAGGYLIIWADNDEDQEGLHANFKLSKSGESILLMEATMSIIDEITFDQQITDTTYGRFPNGTGAFEFMPPTFGEENVSTAIGLVEQNPISKLSLTGYPNPFQNQLSLAISLSTNQQVRVEMMNLFGQTKTVLKEQAFDSGKQILHIDTSQLAAGFWICKLISGNEVKTIKLLKL